MLISADMSLGLLGEESNLSGSDPAVRLMRELLVRYFDGQDTIGVFRDHQKKWFALWDEAIDAAAIEEANATPKRKVRAAQNDAQLELL